MDPSYSLDVRLFAETLKSKRVCEKLKKIKLVISDIDGCLASSVIRKSNGEFGDQSFSAQDGQGIRQAMSQGLHVSFITARKNEPLVSFCKRIGIPENLCVTDSDDKRIHVKRIQEDLMETTETTLFFGDDLQDLQTRSLVSLFATPSDAVFYIQTSADIIVSRPGGAGAFRTILDLILYVQEKHPAQKIIDESIEHFKRDIPKIEGKILQTKSQP